MALRLKYAGVALDRIEVRADLDAALDRGLGWRARAAPPTCWPPTRRCSTCAALEQRGLVPPFWEAHDAHHGRPPLPRAPQHLRRPRQHRACSSGAARWRGHRLRGAADAASAMRSPRRRPLSYLGGGQDRDQLLIADDLARHAEPSARGGGRRRRRAGGLRRLPAARPLLPRPSGRRDARHRPRRPGHRGRQQAHDRQHHARLPPGRRRPRSGWSDSRTTPAAPSWARAYEPLGQVVHGHGNNGEDGGEGVQQGR